MTRPTLSPLHRRPRRQAGDILALTPPIQCPRIIDCDIHAVGVLLASQYGDDLIYTTTLFAGTDTLIGPLYLAYGYAEEGRSVFYLSLGQTFGRGRFR